MTNRRGNKRKPFRRNIRYGLIDPPEYTSFITDLSDTGICIHTNKIFTPGTKLFLAINTNEGSFKAEGIVIWAKKSPPHLIRHMKSGMGIKFTRVDEGLLKLYREKL